MTKQSLIVSNKELIAQDLSRIIEMAWEDRTPFESIEANYGLDESALMKLMRAKLKFSSYKLWRVRVKTKSIKHLNLRTTKVTSLPPYPIQTQPIDLNVS